MAKVSSTRIAAIAARVMSGGDWSTKDVRALAASVLAQAEKAPKPRRKDSGNVA